MASLGYTEPAHSLNHKNCPACESSPNAKIVDGVLIKTSPDQTINSNYGRQPYSTTASPPRVEFRSQNDLDFKQKPQPEQKVPPYTPAKSPISSLIDSVANCVNGSPTKASAPKEAPKPYLLQLANNVIVKMDGVNTPEAYSCVLPGEPLPEGVREYKEKDNAFLRFVNDTFNEKPVFKVLLPNRQMVNVYDLSPEPSTVKALLKGMLTTNEEAITLPSGRVVFIDAVLLKNAPFDNKPYKVNVADPWCLSACTGGAPFKAPSGPAPAASPAKTEKVAEKKEGKAPVSAAPSFVSDVIQKVEGLLNMAAGGITGKPNQTPSRSPEEHPGDYVKSQQHQQSPNRSVASPNPSPPRHQQSACPPYNYSNHCCHQGCCAPPPAPVQSLQCTCPINHQNSLMFSTSTNNMNSAPVLAYQNQPQVVMIPQSTYNYLQQQQLQQQQPSLVMNVPAVLVNNEPAIEKKQPTYAL
eukprot:GDKJ01036871.1.p1 GENE.GDKJ01036871.1~~GDKJ01036871.1.p1  ORF type:complete len:467 (+),score=130.63 GDKJ01036871.1:41-1441(+)